MTELLAVSALSAFGINAVLFVLFGVRRRTALREFGIRRYALFAAACAALCFVLLFLTGAAVGSVLPPDRNFLSAVGPILLMEAVLCGVWALCTWMLRQPGTPRGKAEFYPILRTSSGIVACLLFCEIFVFHALSFVPAAEGMSAGTLNLGDAVLSDGAGFSEDGISIGADGGSVLLRGVNRPICCFRIQVRGNSGICRVRVAIEDDNFAAKPYECGSYDFCIDSPRTMVLPVYSTGSLKEVRFTFDSSCSGLLIQKIEVNRPDFLFSFKRFLLLSLLAVGVFLIVRKKLWLISYRPDSDAQNGAIVLLTVCLCLLSVLLGKAGAGGEIAYPFRDAPESYGCYLQQFDAFQKGQLNLDLRVDPKLRAMKDPYDYSARKENGVSFDWDRSYYGGKYYSYFGTVPIFTVYYPYYFLRGALPSDGEVGMILALCSIPLIVLLIRELALKFCRKINLLLLLLGTAAAVFSSMLLMLQISADFYYIAYLSEMLFGSAFLLFALRAERARSGAGRTALLFFSGLAYVLAVGSRPVAALFLLLVLPVLFRTLLDRRETAPGRILQVCAFAVPVLLGAFAMMAYNCARFDSPFEFGTAYQLTVDHMQYNRFHIRNILPAVYHYFFQFPLVDPNFPFFHAANKQMSYDTSYKLHIAMVGMMSFPGIWWIFGMRHVPSYRERNGAKFFFWSVVLLSLLISVMNYSISGTDIRYVTDFSLPLSALATVVILDADSVYTACGSAEKRILRFRTVPYVLACISLALSILVGAAAVFSNERNTLFYSAPGFYADLERLFRFW